MLTLADAYTNQTTGQLTMFDRIVFKSRYALATPGAPGLNISRDIKDEDRRAELRAITDGITDPKLGLVLRSAAAAAAANDEAVLADAEAVLALARRVMDEPMTGSPGLLLDGPDAAQIAWREWPTPDSSDDANGGFDRHGVTDMIAALEGSRVDLSGSGHFFVDQKFFQWITGGTITCL